VNKIIVIVGFSNSGKDTVAQKIAKDYGYEFVVSTTTRKMRDYESERNPYIFIDNKVFETMIKNGDFIEYRAYHTEVDGIKETWYYGVENSEIKPNTNYVVVLDIIGLRGFKEHFGDDCTSFFLTVDEETRKQRCLNRGDFDETEWLRRLEDDNNRFPNSVILEELDCVVLSYEVEETVEAIMKEVRFNG